MSNVFYTKGLEHILRGDIPFVSGTIKLYLIDVADYTVNAGTHETLSDVPVAARVAVSPALSGKSATGGVANATSPVTWPLVTGDPSEAAILALSTGVDSTSLLVCYYDTASSGLPVTPNGGDINFVIDPGANKLFAI